MAKPTIDVLDPVAADEFAEGFARVGNDVAVLPATALNQMADIWGTATTARKVEVARDESAVLRKITTYAAAAGEHWFYRWPVQNRRKGTTDIVEGISIKGANAVSRLFGNCSIDVRVFDTGRTFTIYAKFSDLETGYSLVRPFQQDKGGAKLGGDDDARRLDMALQIGVSKGIRNVVNNALETFCTFALEQAKANLVGRVGKDLPRYRARLAQKFADLGVDIKRVEATAGRPLNDWLAPDVARIIAEVRAVDDGMASADETWPLPAPPEPRRGDAPADAQPVATSDAPEQATGDKPADDQQRDSGSATSPESRPAAGLDTPPATNHAPVEEPPPANWRVPDDVIGQANIIRTLDDLLALAKSAADVDAIENQNAERLSRITGLPKANLAAAFKAKRAEFGQ
jgi:hypothetical protein